MTHSHVGSGTRYRSRLGIALLITVTFVAFEAGLGLLTGSLILLADAGHMATDAVALSLALLAIWVAGRPANERKTYGYYRAEILTALVNVVLLFGVSGYIFVQSARDLLHPHSVPGAPIIVAASMGLVVNLTGAGLLKSGSDQSMNMRAAYLDMLGDILGAIGAISAGIILVTTGWTYADPLFAAAVGVLILPRALSLLKGALDVLLEGTPVHVHISEVQQAILTLPGVASVHDLHIWTVTSGFIALSGHVQVVDAVDRDRVLVDLGQRMHERFDIAHVTIQVETERLASEVDQPCFPGQTVCYAETSEAAGTTNASNGTGGRAQAAGRNMETAQE